MTCGLGDQDARLPSSWPHGNGTRAMGTSVAAAGTGGRGFDLGTSVFGVGVPLPGELQCVFAKRVALSHKNQ